MQVRSNILRVGIRGFGGEIGDTMTRTFMAMRRPAFDAFKGATGGSIRALIRRKGDDLRANIQGDRSFLKLTNAGTLAENTASSYGYTDHILRVEFDPEIPGRVNVLGSDGRVLAIDYKAVPETNRGLSELEDLDFLIDATGVGLKKVDDETKDQDPNIYAGYSNLFTLFSAPVKSVKGIPHLLNGLNIAEPGKLNATGSCSTHAGVDLIRYVREGIIDKLSLGEGDFIIDGGLFDTTHSLTPSDLKTLQLYEGAYVPQTTGFGSAAKTVYPVPNIGNIDAATGRYNSFFRHGNIQANGVSVFSLSMTFSVAADKTEVSDALVKDILREASADFEGRKHIGIISPNFVLDDNKKTGIFTGLSLTGMTPTAMLPLEGNIKIVRIPGSRVFEGKNFDSYILTIKNIGYDNRLGFTVDMLEEANTITRKMFGLSLIPNFHHQIDVGAALAFVSTPVGQQLFAKAHEKTEGSWLVDLGFPGRKDLVPKEDLEAAKKTAAEEAIKEHEEEARKQKEGYDDSFVG